MRIDKFLKNARIIRRRSMAKQACEQGRISINGSIAKPSVTLKVGDKINIEFGTGTVSIEVVELIDSQRKEDAEKMYKII